MSEEVKNQNLMEEDPFKIFGTKVEDVTSYEEPESRDWSKTFLELDPEKGPVTVLVKLCTNVFDPKDPLPKRYTYKLPYPDNADRTYTFVSPSTVGKACPVMQLFWDLNAAAKKGDATADAKKKNLSRKRNRAVMVQIINDLKNPAMNGQFRILRFPEGMELDKIIASKLNPSEDDRKMGAEAVNVFDPVCSPLLILKAEKGQYGRDFSKSTWAPDKNNHGNMVPSKTDANGNVLEYRVLTEADRNTPELRGHLMWLVEQLKKSEVSLKEQWLYKEPTAEELERVKKSLELISTGQVTTTTNDDGTNKLKETVQPATTAAAQPAAATQPAQPAAATQPAAPAVEAPKPAAASDDAALMAELGLN